MFEDLVRNIEEMKRKRYGSQNTKANLSENYIYRNK
jgi:hypothetical protein